MASGCDLETSLKSWAKGDAARESVAQVITSLARAAVTVAGALGEAPLTGEIRVVGAKSTGEEAATRIDERALGIFLAALAGGPVAAVLGDDRPGAILLEPDGPLLLTLDPLDGGSNVDTNAALGSIFSLLPAIPGQPADAEGSAFLQPGERILAAGFFLYGPATLLALTLGEGTEVFALSPAEGRFRPMSKPISIPPKAQEYAINASNYRHWDEAVRMYVDDCLRGAEGIRGADFNMRWIGSLVAEVYRIFMRGGIYLYPADQRAGYGQGRLRLIYEANPIAMIIEQAGGSASDGRGRILSLQPKDPQQQVPVIAGSRAEVAYVERLYRQPQAHAERSPLFGRRGLFRRI